MRTQEKVVYELDTVHGCQQCLPIVSIVQVIVEYLLHLCWNLQACPRDPPQSTQLSMIGT